MRVITDATYLFFGSSYSPVSVFNAVDASTGAPIAPVAGTPASSGSGEGGSGNINLDDIKSVVEDIQGHISTLQQMNAYADATQQQTALEGKLQECKKSLDAQSDSCQSMILEYKQNGVPNYDNTQGNGMSQAGAVPNTPLADAGGIDPVTGMPMDTVPSTPTPVPQGQPPLGTGAVSLDATAGGYQGPPAGSSTEDMPDFQKRLDQNKTSVVGSGGSSAR